MINDTEPPVALESNQSVSSRKPVDVLVVDEFLTNDFFHSQPNSKKSCCKKEALKSTNVSYVHSEEFGSSIIESNSHELNGTIFSGESLFKCFRFESSGCNDNVTKKCLAFWKAVNENPLLQPCPCTILNLSRAPKSERSNETDTTEEECRACWYDLLLEFQKKKIDDVAFAATNDNCKLCDRDNAYYDFKKRMHPTYKESELRDNEDITCLNDWRTAEKRAPEFQRASKCVKCGMLDCTCYDDEQKLMSGRQNSAYSDTLCTKCGVLGCTCMTCHDSSLHLTYIEKLQDSSTKKTSSGKTIRLSKYCSECGLDGCYCDICKSKTEDETIIAQDQTKICQKCHVTDCNCQECCDDTDDNAPATQTGLGSQHNVSLAEVIESDPELKCSKCGFYTCFCDVCSKHNSLSKSELRRSSSKSKSFSDFCKECKQSNCNCSTCSHINVEPDEEKRRTSSGSFCTQCGCGVQKCLCSMFAETSRKNSKEETLERGTTAKGGQQLNPFILKLPTVQESIKTQQKALVVQTPSLPSPSQIKPIEQLQKTLNTLSKVMELQEVKTTEQPQKAEKSIKTPEQASAVAKPLKLERPSEAKPRKTQEALKTSDHALTVMKLVPLLEQPSTVLVPTEQRRKSGPVVFKTEPDPKEILSQTSICAKCGKVSCSCAVCAFRNIPTAALLVQESGTSLPDISLEKEKGCPVYGTKLECPCEICEPLPMKPSSKCTFCVLNCKCWENKVDEAKHFLDDLKYNSKFGKVMHDKACSTEKYEEEAKEEEDIELPVKKKCAICGEAACSCKSKSVRKSRKSEKSLDSNYSSKESIQSPDSTKTNVNAEQRPSLMSDDVFHNRSSVRLSLVDQEFVDFDQRSHLEQATRSKSKAWSETTQVEVSPKVSQKECLLTLSDLKQRTTRKSSLAANKDGVKILMVTPEQRAKNIVAQNINVVLRNDKYGIPQAVKYRDGRSIPKAVGSKEMFSDSSESLPLNASQKSESMEMLKGWSCLERDVGVEEPGTNPEIRYGRKL